MQDRLTTVLYEPVAYPTTPHKTGNFAFLPKPTSEPRNAQIGKITLAKPNAKKKQKRNVGMFGKGNQAAAKDKWSEDRIRKFQGDLTNFRNWLGYNYSEMGRALDFSASYIKLLEGGYTSAPLRQPSEKFIRAFHGLKRIAVRSKKIKFPRDVIDHIDILFSHILGKRFKCNECAKLVKAKQLKPGLEYWWAKVPGQKHCPKHMQARRTRRASQQKG